MTPLKNAAHFVSDYLPQIFMILILIAAFSMARLPVEDTATSQPAKGQLQIPKIASH
ncbi:hypothetical protein [Hydrocarboniclastica marina]|uniref:hypothetical protein n=1 Tax=Hydrocarboniclastica marina TaxID=2259620 RepID=UPI001561C73C|nr:hypothetical protein [Hydrocarboniclastica marina]|tara:strand:+ start:641 stop:811 length:171 start_codon:yes stop_codon:yes gene_type:complete